MSFPAAWRTGTTVNSLGNEYVSSGGVASGTTLSGGHQVVYASGTASGTTIDNGGIQYDLGSAVSTTINTGGFEYVSSGGTATSTTVGGGGQLDVLSSGVASGTTVNSLGNEYVSSGGMASGTTLSGGPSGRICQRHGEQHDDRQRRHPVRPMAVPSARRSTPAATSMCRRADRHQHDGRRRRSAGCVVSGVASGTTINSRGQ